MLHCLVHDWAVMEEQRREEETKQKIERQVGQLMEEFIRSATVALSEQMPNIQRSALKRSIDTQPPDDEVMYPHRLRGIELTEDFFFFLDPKSNSKRMKNMFRMYPSTFHKLADWLAKNTPEVLPNRPMLCPCRRNF